MNRRAFVGAAVLGVAGLAGCTGESSDTVVEAATPSEPAAATSTRTPVEDASTDASDPVDAGQEADRSGDAVRSAGRGAGVTDRFTAMGGPVVVSLTFDYTGMRNSNFIVKAVDDAGEQLSPLVLSVNEVFEETRLRDDPGRYALRFVTHFEPGGYFLDVTHAGGPYGDGAWEAVVEQPGVPTGGESVPLTVEGFDGDVIGPVAFDGPVRVTVETAGPKIGPTDEPIVYNYRVVPTDARGASESRLLNSVETAPLTQSAVYFPTTDVGYLNVHSWGPWAATLEAA
jgi:hypothetical protein